VPNGPALFGSLDETMGHKRRYSSAEIRRLLEAEGLTVERVDQWNKAGAPPWWINSRILRSKRLSKPLLKAFDKTVWIWRRLDSLMPWPGLSLIAVARNPGAGAIVSGAALRREALPETRNAR
jgi:hypothetical protein